MHRTIEAGLKRLWGRPTWYRQRGDRKYEGNNLSDRKRTKALRKLYDFQFGTAM